MPLDLIRSLQFHAGSSPGECAGVTPARPLATYRTRMPAGVGGSAPGWDPEAGRATTARVAQREPVTLERRLAWGDAETMVGQVAGEVEELEPVGRPGREARVQVCGDP